MKIRGADFAMPHDDDPAIAVACHRNVLGLRLKIHSEESRRAECDGGNVMLALEGDAEAIEGGAGARLAFAVEDIDAACAELRAKGARLIGPRQDDRVGCIFEVLDPDGNPVPPTGGPTGRGAGIRRRGERTGHALPAAKLHARRGRNAKQGAKPPGWMGRRRPGAGTGGGFRGQGWKQSVLPGRSVEQRFTPNAPGEIGANLFEDFAAGVEVGA